MQANGPTLGSGCRMNTFPYAAPGHIRQLGDAPWGLPQVATWPPGASDADTVRDELAPWQETEADFITHDTPPPATVNLTVGGAAVAIAGVAATATVTAISAILDLIGPGRRT
jgi:hypothetical protein